jgi:hypothetical protein
MEAGTLPEGSSGRCTDPFISKRLVILCSNLLIAPWVPVWAAHPVIASIMLMRLLLFTVEELIAASIACLNGMRSEGCRKRFAHLYPNASTLRGCKFKLWRIVRRGEAVLTTCLAQDPAQKKRTGGAYCAARSLERLRVLYGPRPQA